MEKSRKSSSTYGHPVLRLMPNKRVMSFTKTFVIMIAALSFVMWISFYVFQHASQSNCQTPFNETFVLAKARVSSKGRVNLLQEDDVLPDRSIFDNSLSILPRMTRPSVKKELMTLLADFIDLLKRHDIEHFMSQGMLLGSFFFHDLIPWDDDIDVMVNIRDVNKLRAMFMEPEVSAIYEAHSFHESVNMYHKDILTERIPETNTNFCGKENTEKTCHHQGKIYLKTSPHAGMYEWRYPFVDFIFYATNETHMYNHELWSRDGKIEIPLDDFYPFHKRPYNNMWIQAPKEPVKFLKAKFRNFQCRQGYWNHAEEHPVTRFYRSTITCNKITHCYAHVRRRRLTHQEHRNMQITSSKPDQGHDPDQGHSPNQGHDPIRVHDPIRGHDPDLGHAQDQGQDPGQGQYVTTESKLGVVEELVLGGVILQSVLLPEQYFAPYELTLFAG